MCLSRIDRSIIYIGEQLTTWWQYLDEKTSSKFMMYTGTDYTGTGGLLEYVPQENIPDFLGGTKKCDIPDTEPVPKSLYKAEWEKGDGVKLWEDTIYKPANILKGSPHEVCKQEHFFQTENLLKARSLDASCDIYNQSMKLHHWASHLQRDFDTTSNSVM